MNTTHTNKSFDKINLDWKLIQSELKLKLGIEVYESWIKKINFVEEFNNYVLLSVPTRFIRDWITSRYLDQILQTIKKHKSQIIRIELKIFENKNDKNQKSNDLNLIKTNENISFIKDSHLQYNSIGLKMNTIKKVMFISAERFMYQFVKSIKSNDMVKFKEYFRNTDVLLIDDIQFMNGKEAMQEEFFHTFNALLDKGSQIIISADRPPNKLSRIQERIKSRFSGGLVVDVQKPDNELRKKIINHKINELTSLYSDKINISEEIQNFICSKITSNVRELVGAINRIVSFSRIYKKLPNLAETKIVLKDLLNLNENNVTIDLIQTVVCKYFKISKNEMLSSRRSRYLVRPRQTAIYLTKILTTKSLPEIGREFSNRDHTTIIHSVKTIEKLKEKNPDMNDNISKLKNIIMYNKGNEI